MRICYIAIISSLSIIVGALLLYTPPSSSVHALNINQFRPITHLMVYEEHLQQSRLYELKGYTGSIACRLQIHGIRRYGIDLDQAILTHDPVAKTARLTLDKPHIKSTSLDHRRSRLEYIDRNWLWHMIPGSMPEERITRYALQEAGKMLEHLPLHNLSQQAAMRHTEAVIARFAIALNLSVKVVWR